MGWKACSHKERRDVVITQMVLSLCSKAFIVLHLVVHEKSQEVIVSKMEYKSLREKFSHLCTWPIASMCGHVLDCQFRKVTDIVRCSSSRCCPAVRQAVLLRHTDTLKVCIKRKSWWMNGSIKCQALTWDTAVLSHFLLWVYVSFYWLWPGSLTQTKQILF